MLLEILNLSRLGEVALQMYCKYHRLALYTRQDGNAAMQCNCRVALLGAGVRFKICHVAILGIPQPRRARPRKRCRPVWSPTLTESPGAGLRSTKYRTSVV